jgi:hypothetical protein
MAQFVTLDSRRAKAHSAPPREALLARWEEQSRRAETEALSAIPEAVLDRSDATAEAGPPGGAQVDRILAAAVADVQQRKAAFSRYELTRTVNRYLPDFLGGLSGEQVTRLLEDLTDEALRPGGWCGTVLLTAPEMVPGAGANTATRARSMRPAARVRRGAAQVTRPAGVMRRAAAGVRSAARAWPATRRRRPTACSLRAGPLTS